MQARIGQLAELHSSKNTQWDAHRKADGHLSRWKPSGDVALHCATVDGFDEQADDKVVLNETPVASSSDAGGGVRVAA